MSENSDNEVKASLPEQFFIEASMKCPRSNVAQAAYIAMRSKESDIDPIEFANLPKTDKKVLANLMASANHLHGKVLKDKAPKISEQRVIDLFARDFNLAQDFLILDNDTLKEIYHDMYKQHKDSENPMIEFDFEDLVRQKFGLRY